MKKIIMAFAVVIATVAVFAQKADNTSATNQSLSPKELMKMQVVKIRPDQIGIKYYSLSTVKQNLPQKELMKTQVAKITPASIRVEPANDPGVCSSCLALSKLSSKEKMKAGVVGIYKCSMYYDVANTSIVKCPLCGMKLTAKK
jgi:hypothetical protein